MNDTTLQADIHKDLDGYSDIPSGSTRALLIGALIELSIDTVKQFRSDYYLDSLWVAEHITDQEPCFLADGEFSFYFSFDECGTYLSYDPIIGLYRKHGYTCRVYQVRGMWKLMMRSVK